jgi:hypothetical protein
VCYECRIKTYASKQWARKDYSLSERDLLTIEPEIVPNPVRGFDVCAHAQLFISR